MLTVGSLCAGIGGFDLGFERAGMAIRWQVEIDPFCRRVLATHWPDVTRYEDLTTLTGDELEPVDVVCAGFPCQPVSTAGRRQAQHDDRWIWPSIARLVGVLRPRYVVLENTPGLFTAGDPAGSAFAEVVGDLAALRFDIEWDVISAADVGAPHLRKRVWIVAHTSRAGIDAQPSVCGGNKGEPEKTTQFAISARTEVAHATDTQSGSADLAEADGTRLEGRQPVQRAGQRPAWAGGMADADRATGRPARATSEEVLRPEPIKRSRRRSGSGTTRHGANPRPILAGPIGIDWPPEPRVGRTVSHAVPERMARLRSLGNAVLPDLTEWIGRRILEHAQ